MTNVVCNVFISYLHKGFKNHVLWFITLLPNQVVFSYPALCQCDHSFTRHQIRTVRWKKNKECTGSVYCINNTLWMMYGCIIWEQQWQIKNCLKSIIWSKKSLNDLCHTHYNYGARIRTVKRQKVRDKLLINKLKKDISICCSSMNTNFKQAFSAYNWDGCNSLMPICMLPFHFGTITSETVAKSPCKSTILKKNKTYL